jgi:6-phosphogluconate dehydrogenase
MQVAVLGLTTTGKIITEKLLAHGHEVLVWNSSKEELEEIRIERAESVVSQKLIIVHSIDEFRNYLRKPRIFWLQLPPGEPTETVMQQLNNIVEAGDIIVDGADSHHKDTQRHFDEFARKGIKFLGIGAAGGVHAYENGFSLSVGGDADAYQFLVPVLDSLSEPNGTHAFFGTGGAGHFVKMIHDSIQIGMMQSIAEGVAVLKSSEYQLDVEESIINWQEGGVISSFLLDMAMDALGKDPTLSQFDGIISPSQGAKWVAEEGRTKSIPTPVLSQAIDFRERSTYDRQVQETFVAKVVAAIKNEADGVEKKKTETAATINN